MIIIHMQINYTKAKLIMLFTIQIYLMAFSSAFLVIVSANHYFSEPEPEPESEGKNSIGLYRLGKNLLLLQYCINMCHKPIM